MLKKIISVWLFAVSAIAMGQENLAADINESVFKLSTTVKSAYNAVYTRDMTVTQYKPDGIGPFPAVVILHGRSPTDRSQPARQRFTQVARYFVRRGFAVWVPTRLGYGESGLDPDPEDSGRCDWKNYLPGYEAAATSTLDVIAYAKNQSFVDPNRIVVVGQSYGGATSITLAAKNPAGVMAIINFAGGGGGDPVMRPANPCRPDLLGDMFGTYGKTARIPTMWIYTENDKYFGSNYPKQWFAEFEKNGGKGEFKALPAFGDNGHLLFSRGFSIWRPLINAFLMQHGFSVPKSADVPAASGFASLDQIDKFPLVGAEAREKYQRFLQLDIPRAFAIGKNGEFAYYSALDAVTRVLDMCKKKAKDECKLYAVDDAVVWRE
ncbi:MAG: dienelactone hydrolase family protein [Burkholderiaceae bacterium]